MVYCETTPSVLNPDLLPEAGPAPTPNMKAPGKVKSTRRRKKSYKRGKKKSKKKLKK